MVDLWGRSFDGVGQLDLHRFAVVHDEQAQQTGRLRNPGDLCLQDELLPSQGSALGRLENRHLRTPGV